MAISHAAKCSKRRNRCSLRSARPRRASRLPLSAPLRHAFDMPKLVTENEKRRDGKIELRNFCALHQLRPNPLSRILPIELYWNATVTTQTLEGQKETSTQSVLIGCSLIRIEATGRQLNFSFKESLPGTTRFGDGSITVARKRELYCRCSPKILDHRMHSRVGKGTGRTRQILSELLRRS
jgi:hypothetical protein